VLGVVIFAVVEPVKAGGTALVSGEGTEMKAAIIALSAATLFAAAPVFAQSVSSKAPGHEMRAKAKKGHPGASGYAAGRKMQANGPKKGYPGASGYAPSETRDITDISTKGGGGGGGY
jgi:hypothetical protein